MCTYTFANDDMKLTIKVIDETGKSVDGARVGIGFTKYLHWSSKEIPVIGFSDGDGKFSASAKADGYLGFNVLKDDYYKSTGSYKFKEAKNGKWEPWNPEITVVLRKKENPIPMYARNTQFSKPMIVPAVDKELGFDLIEYDWLPPYGKGQTSDFIFKLERKFINDRDFHVMLTIAFPNKFDGIQQHREDRRNGSMFKLPRFAPESGYLSKIILRKTMTPDKGITGTMKEDMNYFFRVRSEEQDGKLLRAMYGKIHGDFDVDPRGTDTAIIIFKYFLNPDYTRNMEYGENIFKGLNVGMN
jgi:hypothetical protein